MKRALRIVGLFVAVYAVAYATVFHFRSPAANLRYWCYTPEGFPSWSETVCYGLFRPAYSLHRSVLGMPRHNFDRAPIVFEPGED